MKKITGLRTADLFCEVVELPIYGNKLCTLLYNNSESGFNQALEFCENLGIDTSDYREDDYRFTYGFTFKGKTRHGHIIFIFINNCDDYKEDLINTTSHELYHAIQLIIAHNGLSTLDSDPNEHIAYLVGYINDYFINLVLRNKG